MIIVDLYLYQVCLFFQGHCAGKQAPLGQKRIRTVVYPQK